MEKHILLKGLTCPNCSAKIESEVLKLSGVESASINLVNQTLNVSTSKSYSGNILNDVTKIVKNHEPDVEVSLKQETIEKQILLKGLTCPNCSAKIENEVLKLSGVENASINLVKQTLNVSMSKSYGGNILDDVTKIVKNHEPDVEVTLKQDDKKSKSESPLDTRRLCRLICGALVFGIGIYLSYFLKLDATLTLFNREFAASSVISVSVLVIAYIILGYDVVLKAVKNIFKGRVFDENFLMALSTVGAFVIQKYPEAVAVMLFYQVGEFFQDYAVGRSRRSISKLMDIRPDFANVVRNGKTETVSPESVCVGETIVVKPGEKIPLDGEITDGESMLDTVALTGESVPRSVKVGDNALSGCINLNSVIKLKVKKPYGESTASKIIDLVENAGSRKAPTENFITKFSRYYTPVVVIAAVLLALIPPLVLGGGFKEWILRGFVFLVISCPCALVISIPLAFFGGIGCAGKRGVLVKGGNYLEALNSLETVVFDKTGTLTKGVFKVTSVAPYGGHTEDEVLRAAAFCESLSNHPIAKSIMSAYGEKTDESEIIKTEEIAGCGVLAKTHEGELLAGNDKLMNKYGVKFALNTKIGTKVYVAKDGEFLGSILISDEIKPDSKKAVEGLKASGISSCVMLTGDSEEIAKEVSSKLGLDKYYARLLPDEKVKKVEQLISNKSSKGTVAFVGDGINDAPVLARADVGIAMGGLGSDAAIEAADVVLMTDEPSKICEALKIAAKTKRIVMQNIIFALAVKAVFLVLGAFGVAGMWEAVFGDVGVMVLAVLNSMRILNARFS